MISESKSAILADIISSKITRIILFGSAIENKLALQSDIDIAIEFNKISIQGTWKA